MKKALRFIAVSTIIILLMSLFQITIANATEYGLIYFTDQYGREMSSYWKLDDTTGILTIYGEGAILDYTNGAAPPYTGSVNDIYLGPLVKTVIVEDGITRIGNYAFATISGTYTTPNVNTIYLAESVREIGERAFNRESIKTVIIYSENISFEANAITPEATVYGYAGSCVEDYANSNGNVFVALCREHTIQIVDSVEPGCENQGFSGNKVCTVCGVTIEQGEILDALGHNYKTVNAVAPTCTEDGYSGDVCIFRLNGTPIPPAPA